MSTSVDPTADQQPAVSDDAACTDPVRPMSTALVRPRSGRVLAGVAVGVADHLDVPVVVVRLVFAALAGLGGAGILAYALFWAFVREQPDQGSPRPTDDGEYRRSIGIAAVGLGLAVLSAMISGSWAGWLTGPLGIALLGVAVVWREADAGQRRRWLDGSMFGGGAVAVARVIAGVLLVATGIAVFVLDQVALGQLPSALLAAIATLVGVVVLTVPWWLRMVRTLGEERRARIRTEERAEIAAHLHDSVLQTLALIQRQADEPREVRRLARGQERQLRSWLYGPHGDGGETGVAHTTLVEMLAGVVAEVEDTYAISVQTVPVGDCPFEEPLRPLVQAAREAMVNAAKHSGVGEVSLYIEVEDTGVHVFVRDRGVGFDPDAVPEDRHGLADSVRGRMERHGGTVTVRTTPGTGTEIQLAMPRVGVGVGEDV